MIQFNLLPDVKLSYIKTEQTRRKVLVIAAIGAATMVAITILLLIVVYVFQKTHLRSINNDIKKYSTELQNTPDLNKILTIQNQLNSLSGLHSKKAVASRLFSYITQLTPNRASIAKINFDFTANTLSIVGTADSLGVVNKFADTLKFTKYTTDTSGDAVNAFSDVVLTNFNRSDQKTQYQLDIKFDPVIFDSASDVKLSVPNIISTRSETEKPSELFQKLNPTEGN